MSWYDQPVRDEQYWLNLRKKANENLQRIARGEYKRQPAKEKKSKETTAEEIQSGHMVLEFRELLKIEARYARKKKLTPEDHAAWEEVDARLETLRGALQAHSKQELSRFVRAYNRSIRPPSPKKPRPKTWRM